MARRKISEYRAKTILYHALTQQYSGKEYISGVNISDVNALPSDMLYVLKVDQGVKGRFKKGLVALDVHMNAIEGKINEWEALGFSHFLVEEMVPHDGQQDRYLSFEREREGVRVRYSQRGGIHIEDHADEVHSAIMSEKSIANVASTLGLPESYITSLHTVFNDLFFCFLEINPLYVENENGRVLDAAVEVDDAAEFFVKGAWSRRDYAETAKRKTAEEEAVEVLARDSQASLKLEVFNPDGSLFFLLSGGGASIVLADEAYNLGYGKEIANYGEYSGNPTDEETYTYTKNLLLLLIKSRAPKKVLVIAGGVANFTDIRKTFSGIIRALDERKEDLKQAGVKVFVRRGGPYQEEGLQMMEQFLKQNDLCGQVAGPDMILTDIVKIAIKSIAT